MTLSQGGNRLELMRGFLRRGHLSAYLGEIKAWARHTDVTLASAIKTQGLAPLVPKHLMAKRSLGRQRAFPTPFKADAVAAENPNRARFDPRIQPSQVDLIAYFASGRTGEMASAWGDEFGLAVSWPAMDKRLLEFCLGLPEDQFTRGGESRLLVRRAFANRLPHDVVWQRKRGLQGADIMYRLKPDLEEIGDLIAEFHRVPVITEFLDLDLMLDALGYAGGPVTWAKQTQVIRVLLPGLLIGLFLSGFDDV